jgi:hypothetical protein
MKMHRFHLTFKNKLLNYVRMKTELIILSFIILNNCFSLFAYDYQTVYPDKIALYENEDGLIQSMKIEKNETEANRFIYYPLETIRRVEANCYTPKGDSWTGKKIIISAGWNFFFNEDGDTIKIKTDAGLNESWIAYNVGAISVEAKVQNKESLPFLGLEDSVKTIVFQVFNGNAAVTEHKLNNKKIRLSKRYGLIQTVNFYVFPKEKNFYLDNPFYESLGEYELIGLTNPTAGVQNLTWQEVWNFEVGDEIHVVEEWMFYFQSKTINKQILKFLSKQKIDDKFVYQAQKSEHNAEYNIIDYDIVGELFSESFVFDEITYATPTPFYSGFDNLPGELIMEGGEVYYFTMSNGDILSKITAPANMEIVKGENDCWEAYVTPIKTPVKYTKGLGGPYYYNGNINGNGKRELVYYKKGDTTWGEPLIITGMANIEKNAIQLYIDFKGKFLHIFNAESNVLNIYNMQGIKVKSISVFKSDYQVDISELPSGLYIVSNKDRSFNTKIKI